MTYSSDQLLTPTPSPSAEQRRPAAVIDRSSGAARLLVDGAPFYVRGVELHNSTSSAPDAFADGLAVAAAVHANVVLASVTWEMIEPGEGRFDLSSVERLLHQARAAETRLVLLWFGAWKNGASSYAPAWVKQDWERFPRCVLDDGTLTGTLTPFGPTDLDKAAFEALVHFLEQADGEQRTVLMVQIENEIGMLGASRDHSAVARAAYASPLPPALRDALRNRAGFGKDTAEAMSWEEVTEEPLGRDEAFMAFGYATHVQKLAAAGRRISEIPFFVNAWLDSDIDLDVPGFTVAGGQKPGMYPSGGPLPRVADVWTTIATDVDLFAPDVYFGDLSSIYSAFTTMTGGLFIPEQRTGEDGVAAAFLAWGEYAAIGVSPFGVDSRTPEQLAALTDGYRILEGLAPLLTDDSGHRLRSRGFHLTDDIPNTQVAFGDIQVRISRASAFGVDDTGTRGYGLIIDLADDTFVFAGRGYRAQFHSSRPGNQIGLGTVIELAGVTGESGRILNGDETGGGIMVIHPPRERVDSPFPIAAGHAHTGLSTATVYRMPQHAR